jgi:hypothetical protein
VGSEMEYIDPEYAMEFCGVERPTLTKMKVNGQLIYDKKLKKVRADLFKDIEERKKIRPANWIKNVPGDRD